ncbi:hypothetical protein CL622_03620 [archaeon]|nr:hypothetical protein [archaeon]
MIRLNIAGGFSKFNELRYFFKLIPEIHDICKITVYDGICSCAWNGGRINRDLPADESICQYYYDNDISIALTFTNPVIDISDPVGNEILKRFHRPGNVIISVNEYLLKYIKDEYPEYKHTRSITSFGKIDVPMSDGDFDRYNRLETMYDYIVPRCEHVFDDRFRKLDQSKYEVMLNDTCVYNCPYYGEHFKKIAEQNRTYQRPWQQASVSEMSNIEECWLSKQSDIKPTSFFNPDLEDIKTRRKYGDNYGMDLRPNQISELIEQGVSNFKLTGREMSRDQYISELRTYGYGIISAISDK